MIVNLGGMLRFENVLYPPAGTFALVDIPGWYDKPSLELDSEPIPGQDGMFPPIDPKYGGRYITLVADVLSAPHTDIRQVYWEQFSALRARAYELEVTDPFGTLTATVWPNGQARFTVGRVPWIGRVEVPLLAPDPRKYRAQPSVSTQPAGEGTSDGLEFPLFADGYLDFGDFEIAGGFYLSNAGKADSTPYFRVRGGLDGGFSIVSPAGTLTFTGAVPVGQEVVLSAFAGGRAILNGVDRTDLLTVAQWAPIEPGETRPYSFVSLDTYSSTALLTAYMKDAWI